MRSLKNLKTASLQEPRAKTLVHNFKQTVFESSILDNSHSACGQKLVFLILNFKFQILNSDSGKSYSVKEATLKLMQYCAYRDRSQKEVEDKLLEMRMIPEAREQIIIQLMQEDFLNEERFARSFVRGKFRIKKWGRYKIKQELKQRQISSPIIKLAMTEINDREYKNTLYALAEKKLALISETDPFKLRKKLSDHLLRKGYESQLVFEVIEDLAL